MFRPPGQAHEPPTPPTTPKTDLHTGNKHDGHQPLGASGPPSSRQNIDFSNVDISELSTEVIGTIDGFDVHEFDQYLPPNTHVSTALTPPESTSHVPNVPSGPFVPPTHSSWTPKDAHGLVGDSGQRPQIKTEQMSPGHCSSSSSSTPPPPPSHQPEYASMAACPSSSSSSSSSNQSDYTDLQGSGFFSAFSGYPAGLYQYFHSSRRSYATPLINGLALAPPPHSPQTVWEPPIYTTLTRP